MVQVSTKQELKEKLRSQSDFFLGYLFRFNVYWTLGPFMSKFKFGPRTYFVMWFIYLLSLESFYSGLGPFVLFVVSY